MKVTLTKIAQEVEVDFDSLPEASKQYIIAYGLKQSLNDAMASAGDDKELALAKALARKDALEAGTVGLRQASPGRTALQTEARAIARRVLRAKLPAKAITEDLLARAAADPRVIALAEKALAERAALAGVAESLVG